MTAAPAGSVLRAMLWMGFGGFALCLMNALMRVMTLELEPMYAQFLRYVFAVPMMLPMVLREGWRTYRPNNLPGQFWRGAVHTASLSLFFLALPHLSLADTTAIMFTTPIFVLLGAALVLREKVTAERWLAALVGFSGVLVVLWPHLKGGVGAGVWSLVMLSASPLFAASFLINKALTRRDSPQVIVAWQNLSVTLFTLPLALPFWQTPTWTHVGVFLVCGFLGTLAHLCMTRAFSMVDISAVQPVRFLDLIWASLLGILLFDASPTVTALAGGAVILASTIWIARRESAQRRAAAGG
jgi:drug/metabolite transporter (DMT)-like permease